MTGLNIRATGADTTSSENRGYAMIVEVDVLTLTNHAQQSIDLRMVFTELTVTTSIFEPAIFGSMLIYDAHALINRFPIVGEETLTVEYKTPGNLSKKNEFIVYKISGEQPDEKGASSSYRLHFCSPEVLRDSMTCVQKSYRTTDNAAGIVEEILTRDLRSDKQFNDTPMKDPAKCLVIPNYSPFEAIDMLTRRGYNGDPKKSDYFMFFERMDGYWLKSLDDLVHTPINRRQREAGILTDTAADTSPDPNVQALETWYVYASDKFQLGSTDGKDIRRIIGMDLRQRFDTLEKLSSGLYESEVVQFSLLEKTLTPKLFGFLTDGQLYLGGSADPGAFNERAGGTGKQPTNTRQFITEFNTGGTGFAGAQAGKVWYRLKDPEEKDGVVKKSGLLYNSVRVGLSQTQLSITVPGDTMVDCGDVVHLVIPQFESITNKAVEDKFLYGKFIIGSLRDSILTPDKHVMTLDLFRDAAWKTITVSELDENKGTSN